MMDPSSHQLYHILNTGKFTYCLICMEDISQKFNGQVVENPVKVHLNGPNHQENVKFLFKLCVCDSFYDEFGAEYYSDIVTRSVFDVSNLLGKKTCYICCINKTHLVCLLCREEVSKMELTCKKIKKKIVNHLQSDRHFKSVKDINWMYHFSSYKSFFRFHKSLLYCSICKESFRFEESSLLQFADSHLKNRHQISSAERQVDEPQDVSQTKDGAKTSETCIKVLNLGCGTSSVDGNGSSVSLPKETWFPPKNKKSNQITCHLCLGEIEVTQCGVKHSIENHCQNNHETYFRVQGPSLVKDIICFNQRFLPHNVILKKYPDITLLSGCAPVFKSNCKHIQIFETLCFCSLCSVIVTYNSDPNNLLRNFSAHFQSEEHSKVLKRKGDTGYDKSFKKKKKVLKRPQQPPKAKEPKKKKFV